MRVVISQSMLFPWAGMLEQIHLADVFVHYDDVQFSKGSFVNRVQIKTSKGMQWMTVPLKNLHLGQHINEVQIAPISRWRDLHLGLLKDSFAGAQFSADALRLAEDVYSREYQHIGELARASLRSLTDYFGLDTTTRFLDVQELGIPGASSERVLAVVKQLNGSHYITGHGAARYLNHEIFEHEGIQVEYIKYSYSPYPQSHGPFTPYVSGLDLVAHCGKAGSRYLCATTLPWRKFLDESTRTI